MWIRDRLDGLFTDEDFEGWFPSDGRPGLSPAVSALVPVPQFAENHTDRQAALAVGCRQCRAGVGVRAGAAWSGFCVPGGAPVSRPVEVRLAIVVVV
jgi:hypothetical protein